MVFSVPKIEENGEVSATIKMSDQEAQVLLQFGMNLAIAAGLMQFVEQEDDNLGVEFTNRMNMQ